MGATDEHSESQSDKAEEIRLKVQTFGKWCWSLRRTRGTYLLDDDAARRYAKRLVRAQLVQGPQWSIEVITVIAGSTMPRPSISAAQAA